MSSRLHSSFVIAEASPSLQRWARNVHRGIEAYFPLPASTTLARLRDIAGWKAYDALRRQFERQWGGRLERMFASAGKAVSEKYTATTSLSMTLNEVDRTIDPELRRIYPLLKDEVGRAFLQRIPQAIRRKSAKADPWDEVGPNDIPEMRDYLARTTAEKIKAVTDNTKNFVRRVVEKGVRDGKSIFDIAKEIRTGTGFSDFRAFMIARTEVIQVSNAATHFGVGRYMPVKGMTKKWLATGDRRTRPTHRRADGQERDYLAPFNVGTSLLMFPGDGSLGASPKEIIQCRCTNLYYPPKLDEFIRNVEEREVPPLPPPVAPKPPRKPRAPRKPKPVARQPQAAPPRPPLDPSKATAREIMDEFFADEELLKTLTVVEDIGREINLLESRWALELSRAETWEARQQLKHFRDKVKVLRDRQLDVGLEATREFRRKYLYQDSRMSWTVRLSGNITRDREMVEKVRENLLEIRKIVGNLPNRDIRTTIKSGVDRAYASGGGLRSNIVIMAKERGDVLFHEFGHIVENTVPEVFDAVTALYKRRTAADVAERLRDYFPMYEYSPDEITLRDRWVHPYIGKKYAFGATELVSSVFEFLFRDPARLMRDDPELFETVWEALRKARGVAVP